MSVRFTVERIAAEDAKASVARETAAGIMGPRYTMQALHQMGWQRSAGAGKHYRAAFTNAFVLAWQVRCVQIREAQ